MDVPTRKAKQTEEDKLFEFINEQIAKFKKYSNLGEGDQVGFYELNSAIKGWQEVNLSLISLGVVAKRELAERKREFNDFFDEKYIEQREIHNPRSITAQKYLSKNEIESCVHIAYKAEYNRLSKAIDEAEMKVAFVRRLEDAWNNQLILLSRLSRNVEAEVRSLNLEG